MNIIRHASIFVFSTIIFFSIIPPSSARNMAVLIGASQYGNEVSALSGPKNDVQQIWKLLVGRGFKPADIRMLADSLPAEFAQKAGVQCDAKIKGRDCPYAANIRAALNDLADPVSGAKKGDFVYLHLSGHGVRVPDLNDGDEEDGSDEAFVPLDVGKWDEKKQIVPNLVTDDMVRAALTKIRQNGAFVWAVFDTCHAGTMTRGADDTATARRTTRAALNIPDEAFEEALKNVKQKNKPDNSKVQYVSPFELALGAGGTQGFVAFYAVQSGDLALEMAFPIDDGASEGKSVSMGVMTHSLWRALAQNPNSSYRQIARSIIDQYGEAGSPAPYFEGDLDEGVFGGRKLTPSWPVEYEEDNRLRIEAGKLHGLSEGAILAIVDAEQTTGKARKYAKVVKAGLLEAVAREMKFKGFVPVAKSAPAAKPVARLVRPGVRFYLKVARPPGRDRKNRKAKQALAAIKQAMREGRKQAKTPIDWVCSRCRADIHLRIRDSRIWLLSSYGDWRRKGARPSPSIRIKDSKKTANNLIDRLWKAARARNLLRVASNTRATTRGLDKTHEAFSIKAFLYRNPNKRKKGHDKRACPKVPTKSIPAGAKLIRGGNVPDLRHCDTVYFEIDNKGENPVDITLLYLDSEAGISSFRPGGAVRMKGGAGKRVAPIQIWTYDAKNKQALSIGRERAMFIAVEREGDAPLPISFKHLAQPGLKGALKTKGIKDRSAQSPFATLINQAGLGPGENTRAGRVPEAAEMSNVVVQTFEWTVRARGR